MIADLLPFSGADWQAMSSNTDIRLQGFESDTFKILWKLSYLKPKETGIMRVPSIMYFDVKSEESTDPWWKDLVPDYKVLPKSELPTSAISGFSHTTVCINTPHYLKWLMAEFTALGGKVMRRTLYHIHEAANEDGSTAAIVNCTGLQSRFLGGVNDQKVFATRGQTVLVRAPHFKKVLTHQGKDYVTYIIPRANGDVILGGTQQHHNYEPEVNYETARAIMERTYKHFPELTHGKGIEALDVVRQNVGLRPTREGGPRVENEIWTTSTGKPILITHNYGHGGYGVQTSWGSAIAAAKLVVNGLKEISGTAADVHQLLDDICSKL
ncbi:D-amino acid oxidase [Umbelopsis sp. WA50703]